MIDDDSSDKLEEEQFDVALVDGAFFSKCFYLIPHRLQIPWITIADIVDPNLVKVPWLPSFVPNPVWPLSDKMTFTDRLKNTVGSFFSPSSFHYISRTRPMKSWRSSDVMVISAR